MIACVFLPDLVYRVAGAEVLLVTPTDYVQAASRAAVRRGVKAGMRVRHAHALYPEAEIRPFDASPFQNMAESIETLLMTFSTQMEKVAGFGYVGKDKKGEHTMLPSSSAIWYLDLGKLRGSDAIVLAQRLQSMLCNDLGLESLVGLSRGKFPALVAARVAQPDRPRLVQLGEEAAFLSSYSISILPLTQKMIRQLDLFGIRTLGAFAALPSASVLEQFGKDARTLHQWAQGHDTRTVYSPPRAPSERLRELLEGGVDNQLVLAELLGEMGCTLAQRLTGQGVMTPILELVLCQDDGKTLRAKRALREPVQNGPIIGRQLVRLLSQLTISCEVISVEVIARDIAPPVMQQLDLFSYSAVATNRRIDLLNGLAARFGTEQLYHVTDLDRDHWLPEFRFTLEPVEAA